MKRTALFIMSLIFIIACGNEEYSDTDEIYQGTKEEWLTDAFNTITSDNNIKAISYWNEN